MKPEAGNSENTAQPAADHPRQRHSSLQMQFQIALGVVFAFFCVLTAFFIYSHEKTLLERNALRKSHLVMAIVESTRGYVREVLRPRMCEVAGADAFVLEAMSTSYITRAIMDRFNENLPEYGYRRVAFNARNPLSIPSATENQLIDFFRRQPARSDWQGIRDMDGNTGYIYARPNYMEASCLRCHGRPEDAPAALVTLYGDTRGFGYKEDDLAGVMAVCIPVNIALKKIRSRALSVFWVTAMLISCLYVMISYLFNRMVVRSLAGVLDIFKSGLMETRDQEKFEDSSDKVEIHELTQSAKDITDHLRRTSETLKRHAEELEIRKELLQSVFDGIPDQMALLDRNQTIRMVNRAFLDWHERTLESVIDVPCRALAGGCECPFAGTQLEAALATRRQTMEEVHTETGETFMVYHYPILNEASEIWGILRYARDITLERQVKQRIQQTEKLAALGQLAAGVAHEINNPMSVILCYSDLLRRQLKHSEQVLKDVATIEKQARSCQRIVSDLLNFSRIQPKAPRAGSINEAVRDVIGMLRHQFTSKGTAFELQLMEEMPSMLIDMDKMKQVFLNLFMNAFQAISGERGLILVRTAYLPTSDTVDITICDNGHGIPAGIVDRIFDPFFSTKHTGEGTGLGLSVSYGIVTDHGGKITVASIPGKGATFTVRLPVASSGEETI